MSTLLPRLQDIERLSARVIRILGGNPGKFTLQGTNTYLIGQGPKRLLIDTGEGKPTWIQSLKRTLSEEQATVHRVLLTHWHHDHTDGVPHLLELCPDAAVHKNSSHAASGESYLPITDGEVFQTEGATLRAFHCPGHTVDHMAFILEEEDAMFTGDNVLGHGTAVFEDLATYMDSLARMGTQFRGRAYPGHGDVVEDGPGRVGEYVRHRRQREEEVLDVLEGKKGQKEGEGEWWEPMEIVKIVYKDVPENLHEPAMRGVVQVCKKLAGEGKVVEDKEKGHWRITGKAAL